MKVIFSREFVKQFSKLPSNIKKKLDALLAELERNPFDSRLHVKHLKGELQSELSFRVTRDWRVIFRFERNVLIYVLRVKNRKDIYR
ncbi:MAG: type II toxin-antitoxin system RelE/ParE family toxin [Patescibacteria group bacterium]|nr:type II toxin-antitoxin system RelE/ParE family toxin [Patescibacteria group bacterium]